MEKLSDISAIAGLHDSQMSEKEPVAESQSQKDASETSVEVAYFPLARKPKWGWGWFLLLWLILPGFSKLSFYEGPATSLIMLVTLISFLPFYFWYRRRLFDKSPDATKISHLSFKAGLVTYLMVLALFFVAGFLGAAQERKDNRIFFSQYSNKVSQLMEEEKKINDSFVPSPKNQKDINHNVSVLKDYLKNIDKRKTAYSEFASYMEKYASRKNNKEIINALNNLNLQCGILFQAHEESTLCLVNYYTTGNENWYRKYEKLMEKVEDSRKKATLSAQIFNKKMKL